MQSILAAMPGYVFAFDRNGICLYVNPRGAGALGHGPSTLIGRALRDLDRPRRMARIVEALSARAFATGEVQTEVVTAATGDNSGQRSYVCAARPIGGSPSGIEMAVCTVLPVVERDQVEDILKIMNHGAVDAGADVASLVEELEIHREELDVQAEELEVQAGELEVQQAELAEKERQMVALVEGERAAAEAARLSEGRFRAIFEQAFAGVADLGAGGHIIRANSTMSELLGYGEKEMVGRRFYSFTSPEDAEAEHELFSRVADGVLHRYTLEKRLVRKDGSTVWVNSSMAAIRGNTPRDDRYVLLLFDDSKQKETEDALRESEMALRAALEAEQEARSEAEAAVRARDEFMSIAAHELKTPVTSMKGFAQTLMRQYEKTGSLDEARTLRSMKIVEAQSNRLSRLTEQLLNLSRLRTGKLALARQETDLRGLVESLASELRHSHSERVIKVEDGIAVLAYVDPDRLEQVLTNLIDNAVKFSDSQAPVAIEVAAEKPGWARIAVRDHGIGVPAEERDRIFEQFAQAHPERHYGGMGIGLFVSKQIVEMHGGTISLEQPEDGGSRFVIHLPLRSDE